ncbi:ABC transporter [Sphingobium sp. WCS2017Hpa-17]|uniref:Gldg family protein n=1 Tax=Sphingobium sp. WCS2017Hpa-17 TaxID=3073638 RepID=UPI00288B5C29|nr:ABC transporter [Sphingobium sp. WCS2017Hpa-17]
MKAGLKRFLWFWLPSVALFLVGLRRAFLTGQADPWDWGLPAALVLGAVGLLLARRDWVMQVWVALGGVGMALVFCMLAAARAPDLLAAAELLTVALLSMFGGALVSPFPFASSEVEKLSAPSMRFATRSKRTAVGIGLIACAVLLLWRGPAQPIRPVPDRPTLAVISGLPLFWDEAGRDGPRDAPIVTILRARFIVTPLDDPLQLKASGARRVLLAQPRALTPVQLVAIDQWVRDGGTALVLADPLLRWPSDLPLGDRRRAPAASLLQPLLGHWGFRPFAVKDEEIRYRTPDGYLVTLSGVQAYQSGADGRWVGPGDWIVQRKPMGKGAVLLLGDADPIDDRLWLADPAYPLHPRYWVADTPARVVHWLGGAAITGDRRWMGESHDVIRGLRWALLAGTIWAMLGAMVFGGERRGFSPRTEGECDGLKDNKSG